MPEIFHIRIKKEYAASLIEQLINEDAVEEIVEKILSFRKNKKKP